MDKSFLETSTHPRSSFVIRELCNEVGIFDVWRELNDDSKEYTFYSNSHGSYSRIDYILIPTHCLQAISSCQIGSVILSDHAPVHLDMTKQAQDHQDLEIQLFYVD